jgi:hypothetical protein
MAQIVYVNQTNQNGSRVLSALAQIRDGLGTLQELDGLRLESIGAGQATMASNFGVADNSQGQALSDRWGALLAAYEDGGNAEYAKLRDMINATTYQP